MDSPYRYLHPVGLTYLSRTTLSRLRERDVPACMSTTFTSNDEEYEFAKTHRCKSLEECYQSEDCQKSIMSYTAALPLVRGSADRGSGLRRIFFFLISGAVRE